MKHRYKILSYPIDENVPLYGDTPKPEIAIFKSIEKGDSSNGYLIKLCNHTGTHIDAPLHFVKGGKSISDYSAEELIFDNPVVVDMPKNAGEWIEKNDLEKLKAGSADILIIRTGFGKFRTEDVYRLNNPGISPEAFLFMREKFRKLRCVGIDSLSISGFSNRPRGRTAHKAAFEEREGFGEPLLLIEDMNLEPLKSEAKRILVIPWPISGIDSAPCTVLAEVV